MFMIFDNQTGTISSKFSLSISISTQDSASPFLLCSSTRAELLTSFHFLLDLERDTITKKVYINLFDGGFVIFAFILSSLMEVLSIFVFLQPSNEFSGCKIEYRPPILVCKPPKRAVKLLTDLTPSGFGQ